MYRHNAKRWKSCAKAALPSLFLTVGCSYIDAELVHFTYKVSGFSTLLFIPEYPMVFLARIALPILFGTMLAASLVSLHSNKDAVGAFTATLLCGIIFLLSILKMLNCIPLSPTPNPYSINWTAVPFCAYAYIFIKMKAGPLFRKQH